MMNVSGMTGFLRGTCDLEDPVIEICLFDLRNSIGRRAVPAVANRLGKIPFSSRSKGS